MIEDIIIPDTKFTLIDGIYQIMDLDFKKKLDSFVNTFLKDKNEDDIEQIDDYEQLPFITSSKYKMDWRLRQEDVININNEIGNKRHLSILEVGPFNSWLTHRLHNEGHKVACVDYFDDASFGLRSKYNYRNHDWISIQCDLEALTFFKSCFDIIVLNHGLQFFSGTEEPIAQLKHLLRPGGKLIILGIFVFINNTIKKQEVDTYKKDFFEKNDTQKFMYSSVKGFFDREDIDIFKTQKIKLKQYRSCLLHNFFAHLFKHKQLYYYGVYFKLE